MAKLVIKRIARFVGVDPGVSRMGVCTLTERDGVINHIQFANFCKETKELLPQFLQRMTREFTNTHVRVPMGVFGVIEYPASKFNDRSLFEVTGSLRSQTIYPLMYVSTSPMRKMLVGFGYKDKEEYLRKFRRVVNRQEWCGKILLDWKNEKDWDCLEALGHALVARDLYRVINGKKPEIIQHYKHYAALADILLNGAPRPKLKKGKKLLV